MNSKLIVNESEEKNNFEFPILLKSLETGNIFWFLKKDVAVLVFSGKSSKNIGYLNSSVDCHDKAQWEKLKDNIDVVLNNKNAHGH